MIILVFLSFVLGILICILSITNPEEMIRFSTWGIYKKGAEITRFAIISTRIFGVLGLLTIIYLLVKLILFLISHGQYL